MQLNSKYHSTCHQKAAAHSESLNTIASPWTPCIPFQMHRSSVRRPGRTNITIDGDNPEGRGAARFHSHGPTNKKTARRQLSESSLLKKEISSFFIGVHCSSAAKHWKKRKDVEREISSFLTAEWNKFGPHAPTWRHQQLHWWWDWTRPIDQMVDMFTKPEWTAR